MEEAAKLQRVNEQLRSELDALKRLVETLREERSSSENNTRSEEERDRSRETLLKLENELLRAQLREQREFVEGCRILMRSMPDLNPPAVVIAPPQQAPAPVAVNAPTLNKTDLLKQGQENSLTSLLLLVSRSQQANDWHSVQLPAHVFTSSSAVPGFNVTCNFRKDAEDESICLRVDGCFPGIPPQTVANGYWETWNNEELFAKTFADFFGGGLAQQPPVPFVIKELLRSEDAGTRVNLYRELHEDAPRDWIYCLTKVKREIALSTLSLPPELNPSVATRRVQHTKRLVQNANAPPSRKRNKGCISSSQLIGREECIVLARSCCTKDVALALSPPVAAAASAPHQHHAINEEGLFVWQDEVSIDFETQCERGLEIERRRVPATRACAFISISSKGMPIQDVELYSAVVDAASGQATERYAKLIDLFYATMTNGSSSDSSDGDKLAVAEQ